MPVLSNKRPKGDVWDLGEVTRQLKDMKIKHTQAFEPQMNSCEIYDNGGDYEYYGPDDCEIYADVEMRDADYGLARPRGRAGFQPNAMRQNQENGNLPQGGNGQGYQNGVPQRPQNTTGFQPQNRTGHKIQLASKALPQTPAMRESR